MGPRLHRILAIKCFRALAYILHYYSTEQIVTQSKHRHISPYICPPYVTYILRYTEFCKSHYRKLQKMSTERFKYFK